MGLVPRKSHILHLQYRRLGAEVVVAEPFLSMELVEAVELLKFQKFKNFDQIRKPKRKSKFLIKHKIRLLKFFSRSESGKKNSSNKSTCGHGEALRKMKTKNSWNSNENENEFMKFKSNENEFVKFKSDENYFTKFKSNENEFKWFREITKNLRNNSNGIELERRRNVENEPILRNINWTVIFESNHIIIAIFRGKIRDGGDSKAESFN